MNEDELTQEDIDEYRKRRQKEYDEATKGNEEIRRKQEEDKKKGLLDEGSAFRTTAAIGTEVGLNTLLDIFSFVPPAQVAGGSAINYLAQRIRGGEFSKGEFVASGLASLLPGGAQAKSLGGVIGKTATRGAVSGALETGAADFIDTGKVDAKNVAAGAGVGGAFGGIFGTAVGLNPDFIRKLQNRVRGGDFVPIDSGLVEGVGTVGAARQGGFSDEAEKKIAAIQNELKVNSNSGNQLGLFTNEGDKFLYTKYKNQNRVIQTPDPTRQQASRVLRPTDFDIFLEEDPSITTDHVLGYIESVKAAKSGKPVLNPATNRFVRNQRGLDGTLRFLNQKSAPNAKFNLNEIADELSAEFNKPITPADISNIIKGNVKEGVISFKTQGMSKPMQLKSIADLRKVYMARVARYKDIPAFERGHVFAADNIIKDKKISNLTDFKDNLEPEIARSIYRQLDEEALEELIRLNVDSDFGSIESLYEQILAGNRSRRNVDDPDKVIAALYGRDYGLRESFLNYVYPNRSLGRLITADSKAAFADLYKKELAERLAAYQGLSVGPAALDKIRTDVAKQVLKSFPDVDSRFVIEQMTLASDKGFGKNMVDELTGEAK